MTLDQFPQLLISTSKACDGNMSFLKGDPKEALENRKKFLSSLNINLIQITTIQLEHGAKIIKADPKNLHHPLNLDSTTPLADGLITNQKGVYLFMIVADCIALSLHDPKKEAIGLIHAGRIGLEKKVLKKAIESMMQNFGSHPQDLIAHFSPSLGPCCYKPVYLKKTPFQVLKHVVKNNKENAIDIWGWAKEQLREAGLLEKNIDNPAICSYCSGQYFSHRKAEVEKLKNDYRFAIVVGLKP